MRLSDVPRDPSRRMLRQFAAAWLIFFLIWAAVQWWARHNQEKGALLAIVAVAVGIPGLLHPPLLRWIFVGWMLLVFPLGWLVSLVLLLVLYYGVFTPVAFCLRLRGRDALLLKAPAGRSSYWLPKETPLDVRSYFRQY